MESIVAIWPADPIDPKRAGPDGKIPPVPRANQIAEFSELLWSRAADRRVMLEQRGIRLSSGVQPLQTNLDAVNCWSTLFQEGNFNAKGKMATWNINIRNFCAKP